MSEVASAFVTLVPSAKGFGKGIGSQIDGDVQREGKRSGGKFGGAMGMGAGAAMARAFAPVAAAATVAAGVSWLAGTADAASDLNETVNKSNVIFGKNAASIDAWAKTAATSMGLSRSQALNAAAGFGDMFSQLGFAGDKAASMSKSVVQMAADLGSFNNLPTAEVADMMAAAFRGEYDSLQRLVPNINATRVETEALAMTGKKSAKELTAQEKAAATLAIVQKDGARAAGDFARTSDGVANKAKIQAARMEDLKAKVGQLTLPLKSLALDAFGGLITFGERALPVIEKGAAAIGGFVKGLTSGSGQAGAFGTAIAAVGAWFQTSLLPAFQQVQAAVMGFVNVALPIVQQFVSGMQARMAPMVPTIQAIFSTIGSIITTAMQLIAAIIGVVTTAIGYVWNRWGSNIMDFVTVIWSTVLTVIKSVLGIIQGIIKTVLSVIKGDWSGAWAGIKSIVSNAWNGIKALISGALGIIKGLLSGAWALIKAGASAAWNGVKSVISSAWDGIKSTVSRKVDDVIGFVKSIPSKAKSALGNLGSTLIGAGRSLIDGFIQGIKNGFDAVKRKLGELTSLLPDWKGPASLDRVILRENGRLVIGGFVDGLEDEYGSVERSLGSLTNSLAVPLSSSAGLNVAGSGSGSASLGAANITVVVSVDDVARLHKIDDFLDMLDRARLDGRAARSGKVSA
jgi:hypothetical protein